MSPANYAITPTGLISSVDNSFYSQATPGGTTQAPYWCGPSTGEKISSTKNGLYHFFKSSFEKFRVKRVIL